jgi:hypothetical protein
MRFIWVVVFAVASAAHASAYVSSEGHTYEVTCNSNGYALTSQNPVARAIGSGADTKYSTGRETFYLGRSCDAVNKILGGGKWCWANGGFLVSFPSGEIGFPRQELVCDGEPDLDIDCRC